MVALTAIHHVLKRTCFLAHFQKCNDSEFSTEIIADSNLIPDTKPSGYVKDNVGSFNPDHRWYFSRAITKVRVALQNDSYQGQNTDHDIMATLSNLGK